MTMDFSSSRYVKDAMALLAKVHLIQAVMWGHLQTYQNTRRKALLTYFIGSQTGAQRPMELAQGTW